MSSLVVFFVIFRVCVCVSGHVTDNCGHNLLEEGLCSRRVFARGRSLLQMGKDPAPHMTFLHIGKTGGSSLKTALEDHISNMKLQMLDHEGSKQFVLDLLHGTRRLQSESIVLFVRAPVHRFVSAWISRLRQGQPDYYIPWTTGEEEAFQFFASPDALACALSSADNSTTEKARKAMAEIHHVKDSLSSYLQGLEGIKTISSSIALVGRTEYMDEDYASFLQLLEARDLLDSSPPTELPQVHNTSSDEWDQYKYLSRCAVLNLRKHYSEDYQIIRYLSSIGFVNSSYADEVEASDFPPNGGDFLKT